MPMAALLATGERRAEWVAENTLDVCQLNKVTDQISSAPGLSAEIPKGGVEFINFPIGPFRSENMI